MSMTPVLAEQFIINDPNNRSSNISQSEDPGECLNNFMLHVPQSIQTDQRETGNHAVSSGHG